MSTGGGSAMRTGKRADVDRAARGIGAGDAADRERNDKVQTTKAGSHDARGITARRSTSAGCLGRNAARFAQRTAVYPPGTPPLEKTNWKRYITRARNAPALLSR